MYQSDIPERLINYANKLANQIEQLKSELAAFPSTMKNLQLDEKVRELEGLEKGIALFKKKKAQNGNK